MLANIGRESCFSIRGECLCVVGRGRESAVSQCPGIHPKSQNKQGEVFILKQSYRVKYKKSHEFSDKTGNFKKDSQLLQRLSVPWSKHPHFIDEEMGHREVN